MRLPRLTMARRALFALLLLASTPLYTRAADVHGNDLSASSGSQSRRLQTLLPAATSTPTPSAQDAVPGTILTLKATFNNEGESLGFAPFYELYLPKDASGASCFEFVSADWYVRSRSVLIH